MSKYNIPCNMGDTAYAACDGYIDTDGTLELPIVEEFEIVGIVRTSKGNINLFDLQGSEWELGVEGFLTKEEADTKAEQLKNELQEEFNKQKLSICSWCHMSDDGTIDSVCWEDDNTDETIEVMFYDGIKGLLQVKSQYERVGTMVINYCPVCGRKIGGLECQN